MYGVEHIVIRAAGLIIADYLIRSYYVFARTRQDPCVTFHR